MLEGAIEAILGAIDASGNDIAAYPNPFADWEPSTNPTANFSQITLVDAGETNQNIPCKCHCRFWRLTSNHGLLTSLL